jgi:hypothetical protein
VVKSLREMPSDVILRFALNTLLPLGAPYPLEHAVERFGSREAFIAAVRRNLFLGPDTLTEATLAAYTTVNSFCQVPLSAESVALILVRSASARLHASRLEGEDAPHPVPVGG